MKARSHVHNFGVVFSSMFHAQVTLRLHSSTKQTAKDNTSAGNEKKHACCPLCAMCSDSEEDDHHDHNDYEDYEELIQ